MLIKKYLVLDEDSFVFDDDTGETALFDREEACRVAIFLKGDGSALVKIIPFRYRKNHE